MGQGYSLTTLSAGSATIDVPELADLTYEKSLGNARFMKCIRARNKDGLVITKVVMKPSPNYNWDFFVKKLNHERVELANIPNALGYHRIQETSTAGYLVRQYIHSSLYDRMSNRPFLDNIEKKWLAFQLICAVRDCHARGIHHGDIKTENILVTSWNWLYLSDFSSSYKPTYLPDDNPSDFNFYLDTSGRRTCYIAPERFLRSGETAQGKSSINWAMDIFSVGCVIAELFLETPIFSLSQLFKYRSGKEYDPEIILESIKDKEIREMVSHMIQLDPQHRYSAQEYLDFWKVRAFPEYFYSFLHQYMYLITDPTSGRKPITTGTENLGEADERVARVYFDFDKISYFLGYEGSEKKVREHSSSLIASNDLFPLQVDIPNNRHQASTILKKSADNGTLLFLTLIEVSLRSTARATARLRACELLLAFAERVPDEAKLDRILPYLIEMLSDDKSEMVKVAALRSITQLLQLVEAIAALNAYIFPEYLLPRFYRHCLQPRQQPSQWLRATYASCLSSLAQTASRFLDMMQALRADGALPTTDPETEAGTLSQSVYQNLYDSTRSDLYKQFELHTTMLLTDNDSNVRRAFLSSISSMCVFFGPTKAADVILSHLNTYLNDRDWELKIAFFETIVGVAAFVGGASLETFILPLMVQALTDPEDRVVERVIKSFSAIGRLGLFQRSTTWELVDIVARFSMHPNTWIREAAVEYISVATLYLSVSECHGIITPMIRVYLKNMPSNLTELDILDALKPPLPRLVLEMATTWAVKADKGVFWKSAKDLRTFSFGAGNQVLPPASLKELGPKAFSRTPRDHEDEKWINRLRNAGLTHEEEFKLIALRSYIFRLSKRKLPGLEPRSLHFNKIIKISDYEISPQIVIFDQSPNLFRENIKRSSAERTRTRTIAEALQDAARPDDGPNSNATSSKQKESSFDTRQLTLPVRSSQKQDDDSAAQSPSGLEIPRPKQLISPTNGPTVASSIDSKASLRLSENGHGIRKVGSAMNLIGRNDAGSKATAEIGTTPTNAFGSLDPRGMQTRSSPLALAKDEHLRDSTDYKHRAAHNYNGHDPNVLKHLDSLYLDNYPIDYIEFGPMVAPKRPNRDSIKRAGAKEPTGAWRPDGNLVAVMGEHTASINRVVVAPDHNFFITGSNDGTVKIWDSTRLERNTTHRARQTYKHAPGATVTSLTFIENTHCFVSTGSDGSVHVVRVDYTARDQNDHNAFARYGKLRVVREYFVPEGDYVVWCEHFKEDTRSVLILATRKGRIIALELRTMTILYELKNPARHGIIETFCVDKQRHWLVVGTSHGVLDLWDLRFEQLTKTWRFPGGSPIYRITLLPTRKPIQMRLAIAGGTGQGEITVWDLETTTCHQAFRSGLCKENTKGYRLIDMDEEKSGGVLSRFATPPETSSNAGMNAGIRAIAMSRSGHDNIELHESSPKDVSIKDKQYFFLTAGPDWKVRFWDAGRPEASMVVSGMELEEGRPSYTTTLQVPDLTIVSERLSPPPLISSSSRDATASPSEGRRRSTREKKGSSIVSMQQQHLLRSHLDTVMDVALLEIPYGMVVSVDRMGCVYVFS